MNIAVTGLNATDNPGPGVPTIRSLLEKKDDIEQIIGLVYDTLEPGIYMENIANNYFVIPYPSAGLDSLFERIQYINSKSKIDVLIPTLDSELYGFIKIEEKLAKLGIKTFLPTFDQLNLRAKDKLFDFCQSNNISMPKNILANSLKDIYQIPEKFKYPVVVKGIFYDAYIVNNFEEASAAFNKLSSKWGYPIIVQEFLKGDEFNVTALGDGFGNTIGAVPMRKLYITDKGKGWSGITVEDEKLMEITHKVISALKWRSGLELEFIRTRETEQYYLLEINPRFPAWVYLATAANQNMVRALVDLAIGKKINKFTSYEVGKIFVRCSWDLITTIKNFEKIAINGEYSNE